MRFLRLWPLALVAACGGIATTQPNANDGGAPNDTSNDVAAGECHWPSSLNPPSDAGPWSWTVAHKYLDCKLSNGGGVACVTDNKTCNAGGSGDVTTCVDQCSADEYAVAAGGPPHPEEDGSFTLPPRPDLPETCRNLGGNPAGVGYYCCPCTTGEVDAGTRGSFACGSKTCDGRTDVCEHVRGGAPPGVDFYDCIPIPTACANDVTCDCAIHALSGRGATACAADAGDLTVDINVP